MIPKHLRCIFQYGIFACLSCFLFAGCMDARELKERTIIETVGIDKKEGEYLITLQKFSPEQQGGGKDSASGGEQSAIVQTEGKTIGQALDKVTHYHGNEVFLGNSSFVIVGKKVAEESLGEVLSFFNANHEISPEICIVMAQDTAEEILKSQEGQGGISPAQIKTVIEQGRKNGIMGRPTLRDAINRLESDCAEPYLPIMELVKTDPKKAQIKIAGMAVFRESKLKDMLGVEDTRAVLWATDEIDHTVLAVNFGKKKDSTASVKILKSKSKMKVSLENGLPVLHLSIRMEAALEEVLHQKDYSGSLEEIAVIEDATEGQVQQAVQQMLERVFYKDRSDVFRYSEFIKKYEPKFWKAEQENWNELIPQCKFVYDITCRISHAGTQAYPCRL